MALSTLPIPATTGFARSVLHRPASGGPHLPSQQAGEGGVAKGRGRDWKVDSGMSCRATPLGARLPGFVSALVRLAHGSRLFRWRDVASGGRGVDRLGYLSPQ